MPFTALGLSEPITRALLESGYTEPTPIQADAIPAVLAGKDLFAAAQTGTGKTAGFTLPILEKLSRPSGTRAPQTRKIRALILTPTRELASQVEESVRTYGQFLKLRTMVMYGGVSINPQKQKLGRQVDVLVATPGRLLDHVGQRSVDLSGVEILVLDEADRMLDMGFMKDLRRILPLLPEKRQNLMFSATFTNDIKGLAAGLLTDPVYLEMSKQNAPVENVSQVVYPVDRVRKTELLKHLITQGNWNQVLVFGRTKHGANRLAEQLDEAGIPATAIHSNKSQMARERALRDFKAGKVRVLVATDIAARGIDINLLPHVVNFELPESAEDYVHRIGRTGRAGAEGEACSLVCIDELYLLSSIEKLIKRKIDSKVIPGFEVDPRIKAEPIRKPQQGRFQRPGSGGNKFGRGGQKFGGGGRPSSSAGGGHHGSKPRQSAPRGTTKSK